MEFPERNRVLPPIGKSADLSNPKNVDAIVESLQKSATFTRKHQIPYLQSALKSSNEIEDKFTIKMSKFFDDQLKRVLANLKVEADKVEKGMKATKKQFEMKLLLNIKAPSNFEDDLMDLLFVINIENLAVEDLASAMATSGVVRGVSDINRLRHANVDPGLKNPFVKSAIANLADKIKGINITTKKAIEKAILKGAAEGWTMEQLQTEITRKFSQFSNYRARAIARTESRAAWDAGAQTAYTELGVKTVDVVGCTEFENDSDCGRQNIPTELISTLNFHPNHIGSVVPSEDE